MSAHPDKTKNPDKDVRVTPSQLFRELDHQYHFTVDVAASADNAKCARYFDKEMNGLAQSWQGEVVWCNPPYSEIRRWVEKAWLESQGDCKVVMLLPALTEVKWFHDLVYNKARVLFIRGRLCFGQAGGGRAPFASMLVFWGLD